MKRLGVFVLLLSICVVGCRKETPAPPTPVPPPPGAAAATAPPADLSGKNVESLLPTVPPVASKCLAGAKLGPDGTVTEPKNVFSPSEPLHLTMWLNESPAGLQVAMSAKDQSGEEVARATREAGGAKTVTLRFDNPLPRGTYNLEGYWGGNLACEQTVVVE